MSLDNDSASDEELDDDNWQEYTDPNTGKIFYFSPSRNEKKDVKPEGKSWEHSLIGTKVRIYWPMEDEWFEGEITDYHLKKANTEFCTTMGSTNGSTLGRSKTV